MGKLFLEAAAPPTFQLESQLHALARVHNIHTDTAHMHILMNPLSYFILFYFFVFLASILTLTSTTATAVESF